MPRAQRLMSSLLVAAVALLTGVVTAPPAGAATASITSVTMPNISIDRAYKPVTVTVRTSGSLSYLSAYVYGPSGIEDVLSFDYVSGSGGTLYTARLDVYDWDYSPGTYVLRDISGYDAQYNVVTAADRGFYVKAGGRATLAASRSGSYVSLTAGAAYYSPASQAWKPRPAAKVTFQYRLPGTGTWKYATTATTTTRGTATARVLAGTSRYWRALVPGTSSVWAATSAQRSA